MISSSRLRQWHAYIGLFIAPSVLFFALTGAVQLFDLHKAHESYRPAALVEMLSALHTDQVFERPQDHAPHGDGSAVGAGDDAAQRGAQDDDKVSSMTLVVKWFFLIVALGLSASTSIGVWMGVTQIRRRAVGWLLLAAGVLIPVCLVAI